MEIKAIFFDMGGTLAYGTPDPWKIFTDVCSRRGLHISRAQIDAIKPSVDRRIRSRQFLTRELLELYPIKRYGMILESLGVGGGPGIAAEIQAEQAEKGQVLLYDDVPRVIRLLREAGFFLGILSNAVCTLEEGCERLRINKYFDIILASDLLLASKPEARMFQLAASEADVPPECCLHVGDSFRADYEGARRSGMKALLLDRDGTSGEDCPTIATLDGVLRFLGLSEA